MDDNHVPFTTDDVIKFIRDSVVFRAAIKDAIRMVEDAEAQKKQQAAIEEAFQRASQCTCCPVHPRYDIPFGGGGIGPWGRWIQ